jgi:mannose-1-phosphate guanylyltransferase
MSEIAGGILCAGFGTRLRPLTEAIPKPLLPFLNTPIVTYAMERLKSLEVQDFAVNLHHLADAIPPVVDTLSEQFGMEPVYSREWEILGSGGGLRGLWRALGEQDQTLVVLNGDSVMDVNLGPAVIRHERSSRAITLIARPRDDGQPGRVWLDPEGKLQGIRDYRRPGAPPDEELVEHDFTGVHIVEGPALDPVPLENCDIIDTLYGPMLEADDAIGVDVCEGFWAALDNPSLYLETTRRVLEDPSLFSLAPFPQANAEGLWFFNEDGIDDKAEFAAPVFCGAHVKIEPGARIGPNVVLDGTEVKSGARVENAVLYGMGTIEGEWRDCVAVAGKVASV